MAIFKLYLDNSNKYRWNLNQEERDDIFADSGRGYTTKNQALDAIALVRTIASGAGFVDRTDDSHTDPPDQLTNGYFELYRDNGNKYRWRLKSQEDILICDSTHGLVLKEDALRDIQIVLDLASDATLQDQTEGGGAEPQVPYNLGSLPTELTIHWPAPPQIEYTVEITTSPDDGVMRVEQGRTRFVIAASLERLTLSASDMEVQVNEGIHIAKLFIERGLSRFSISGGSFGSIELALPYDENGSLAEELLVQDVLVNNVSVTTVVPDDPHTPDNENIFSAFYLRGKRIAVLNSRIQAFHYSVWLWANTEDFSSEDIILAGNVFESAGPEATVRLVSVLRSVVIDNVMMIGGMIADNRLVKHNYRVHGRSDLNFASGNTLFKGALKFASEPPDFVGTIWFNNNTIYHLSPGLLDLNPPDDPEPITSRLRHLIISNNVIFSEAWEYLLAEVPGQWTFENNYIRKLVPS